MSRETPPVAILFICCARLSHTYKIKSWHVTNAQKLCNPKAALCFQGSHLQRWLLHALFFFFCFWQRQVKVNKEERKIEIVLNSGWHHISVLLLSQKDKFEQTHSKKKQDRKKRPGSTLQHMSDWLILLAVKYDVAFLQLSSISRPPQSNPMSSWKVHQAILEPRVVETTITTLTGHDLPLLCIKTSAFSFSSFLFIIFVFRSWKRKLPRGWEQTPSCGFPETRGNPAGWPKKEVYQYYTKRYIPVVDAQPVFRCMFSWIDSYGLHTLRQQKHSTCLLKILF